MIGRRCMTRLVRNSGVNSTRSLRSRSRRDYVSNIGLVRVRQLILGAGLGPLSLGAETRVGGENPPYSAPCKV